MEEIIKKQDELIELLFIFHDLHRSNIKTKMSYSQWREKVVTLQTEIKMLKNGYRRESIKND